MFNKDQELHFSGARSHPDTGLIQRRRQIERQMKHSGSELLRLQQRVIHGRTYEESAAREPDQVTSARVPGHSAVLQTDQSVEGRSAPFFKMLMFNGHYIPSLPRSLEEKAKIPDLTRATLSEGQVLALWEAITATLRPRPGAL
ncbi:MAG: T6SS immunity protein Tli4 family protein [Caldimonas sp.]|uniref:T6SS immunity protein Tli4 family protein n=1 Tax=Caldimonas sp. TaxID=2838790 RepID=UPI00391C47E7